MAKAKAKVASENPLATLNYGAYDGAGFEGVDETHLKVPFLKLLQDTNDETKSKHEEYVTGAEPGMFMNSVTKQLFDEVEFVPAMVDHCFVEWRRNRGGFVGRHDLTSGTVSQARASAPGSLKLSVSRPTEDGGTEVNDLIETFYVGGVIVLEGDEVTPAILALSSTKIGQYKEWMTRVNMFTIPKPGGGKQRPPLFAHRVKLTAKAQSHTAGDSFNIVINPLVDNDLAKSLITDLSSPLFLGGQEVRKMLGSGEAKIDYDTQGVGGTGKSKEDDDF